MRHAANVRDFQRKSFGQFAANGKVNRVCIRCLQILVQARTDEEGLRWECLWKRCGRSGKEDLIAVQVCGRDAVKIRQPRRRAGREESGRVGQLGGKAERTVAAEVISDTLAETVVHHAEAAA